MVEHLILEGTSKTPSVDFNALDGHLEIKGLSVPENVPDFYHPLLGWLKKYVQQPAEQTIFVVQLSYLNTSSIQIYFEMFSLLKEFLCENCFRIEWYYLDGDSDMKEVGEDFMDALEMNMKIIAVEIV